MTHISCRALFLHWIKQITQGNSKMVKEQWQLTANVFFLAMFLVREYLHRPWTPAKAEELKEAPSTPLHFLPIKRGVLMMQQLGHLFLAQQQS
jgi:hypothetical protein